jgi:gentisate 1,2-dioxygenase
LAVSARSLKRKPLVLATFIQLLPPGFKSSPYRSTDATVLCVTEGRGRTRIGRQISCARPKAIFVAPRWHPIVHEAIDGACMPFSFSDRVVQEKLRIWREQRENF